RMKTMLGLVGGAGAAASRVTAPASKRAIRQIDFMGLGIDDRRSQDIGNRSNIQHPISNIQQGTSNIELRTSNFEQPANDWGPYASRFTHHVSRFTHPSFTHPS